MVLFEVLWRLTSENQHVSLLYVSEEKINQLLNRGGKQLLLDLLIRIIFSIFILSLNFKSDVFLNKGLVKELWGWNFLFWIIKC